MNTAFVPKLLTTLKDYDRRQLVADVTAGAIVGIVALPLAIAFAIASGVTPERGLYTAIVAGFLISALGGSRVQIGGPTGAFVVVVYSIVQRYGIDGLTVATLMAGVILLLLGLLKMGTAIKFIPHPVITGFTSGIAVIILSSQVKDLLGLRMGDVPAEFAEKWLAYFEHIATVSLPAVGIAALALAILFLWPLVNRRIPGAFIALLVTTAVVHIVDLPVETIASKFGGIPSSLPQPVVPRLSFREVTSLVSPAFSIALLGAIESLLSAVVADGMIGGRHRSNMELVAQGIANIASPLVGGIPATGAIARTATNIKNGGRTPVAGMVHAVVLLLITLFFGKWAGLIPLATLAAILVIVAYHMSEWRTFRAELRSPASDIAVLLATFFLTIVVDLTVAIEVGMVLACFLFMRRMAEVTNVTAVTREFQEGVAEADEGGLIRQALPKGVEVYEINGPFFFGAAENFKDTITRVASKPKVLIIRMRNVSLLDSTAMRALKDVVKRFRGDRTLVLLSEVHAQPLMALERSELFHELGDDMFMNFDDALDRARDHLAKRTTGQFPAPPVATER